MVNGRDVRIVNSNPQIVVNGFHKANAINDMRMSDDGHSSRDPEIISDNSNDSDDSSNQLIRLPPAVRVE